MSHLVKELRTSIGGKWYISILLYVVMTCLLFLISVLYAKWFDVDNKTKSFLAQYENQNIYQLSDELTGEREEAFWNNPAELDILKKLYRQQSATKEFSYVISNNQSIGVVDFKGNEKLLYGYEDNSVQPDYGSYSFPKAIQINKKGIERFIVLSEGSLPDKEDYIYKKDAPIPVLLGAEYVGIYNVGDKLTINYLNYPFQAVVSGILKENVMIPNKGKIEFYLDRFIVVPFLDFTEPVYEGSFFDFQQRHYLNAINGDIYTAEDPVQTHLAVKSITDKVGFNDYQIIGSNGQPMLIFIGMLEQNKVILLSLVIILACFTVFGVAIASLGKWNLNMKRYAIYLISGATYLNIFTYLLVEMSFILFLSFCTVFVFMSFVSIYAPLYYIGLVGSGILLILFGLIPLLVQMKRMNLVELLKKV